LKALLPEGDSICVFLIRESVTWRAKSEPLKRKKLLMSKRRRVLALSGLSILFGFGQHEASAQSTIINVPSADVVAAKKVYVEMDFLTNYAWQRKDSFHSHMSLVNSCRSKFSRMLSGGFIATKVQALRPRLVAFSTRRLLIEPARILWANVTWWEASALAGDLVRALPGEVLPCWARERISGRRAARSRVMSSRWRREFLFWLTGSVVTTGSVT
jgi:hypothetical protein